MSKKRISEITALCALFAIFYLAVSSFMIPAFTREKETEVKGSANVILNAVADAWVEQKNPTSNKDVVNIAKVGLEGVNQANRIYIKHDVSSIPSNATITNAYINVRMFNAYSSTYCFGTPTSFSVAPVSQEWNETNVTWSNKPGNTEGISANLNCSSNYQNITITSIVQNWVQGSLANNGIVVYGNETGSIWMRQIYTKNITNPVLTVWYTTPDQNPTTTVSNPPAGSTSSNTNTSTKSSTAKTDLATSSEAEKTVDQNISAPAFTSVFVNLDEKKAPITETLEITQNDKLNVKGTGEAGSKVVIFLGEGAFETTVDSEGKWSVLIEGTAIIDGEYLVQAQAQKDDKGSEKITFFNLKKSTNVVAEANANCILIPACASITAILLVGIGCISILFLYHKKRNKLTTKTNGKGPKSHPSKPLK